MKVFNIIPEIRILRMTFHRVILKMLNKEGYISFSDLFAICLSTTDHINMKLWILSVHTASFKIEISKGQGFGKFELSPMCLTVTVLLSTHNIFG